MLPENQTPTGNTTEQKNTSTPENETQNKPSVDEQQPTSAETNQRSIGDICNEIKANQSKRHGSAKKRFLGLNWLGHAIKDMGRHVKRKSLEKETEKVNTLLYTLQKTCSTNDMTNALNRQFLDQLKSSYIVQPSGSEGCAGYALYVQTYNKVEEKNKMLLNLSNDMTQEFTELFGDAYVKATNTITQNPQLSLHEVEKYLEKQIQHYSELKNNISSKYSNKFTEKLEEIKCGDQLLTLDAWCADKNKTLKEICQKINRSNAKPDLKNTSIGNMLSNALTHTIFETIHNRKVDKTVAGLAKIAIYWVTNKCPGVPSPFERTWNKLSKTGDFSFCVNQANCSKTQKRLLGIGYMCLTDCGGTLNKDGTPKERRKSALEDAITQLNNQKSIDLKDLVAESKDPSAKNETARVKKWIDKYLNTKK